MIARYRRASGGHLWHAMDPSGRRALCGFRPKQGDEPNRVQHFGARGTWTDARSTEFTRQDRERNKRFKFLCLECQQKLPR